MILAIYIYEEGHINIMNMKSINKHKISLLSISISLPVLAFSLVITSNNIAHSNINKAKAFGDTSTPYDGYRLLTSEYGIMDNVKLVIANETHAMSTESSQSGAGNYYIKASEVTISDNQLTLGEKTAEYTLKLNSNGYTIGITGSNNRVGVASTTKAVKYDTISTTNNDAWGFTFDDTVNQFIISLPNSTYGPYYLGYRSVSATTNGYQHAPKEDPAMTLSIYVDVQSVITAWAIKYLNYPNEVTNQCETLFDTAKAVLDDLGDMYKCCLAKEAQNKDYLDRYIAWASHLHKTI